MHVILGYRISELVGEVGENIATFYKAKQGIIEQNTIVKESLLVRIVKKKYDWEHKHSRKKALRRVVTSKIQNSEYRRIFPLMVMSALKYHHGKAPAGYINIRRKEWEPLALKYEDSEHQRIFQDEKRRLWYTCQQMSGITAVVTADKASKIVPPWE